MSQPRGDQPPPPPPDGDGEPSSAPAEPAASAESAGAAESAASAASMGAAEPAESVASAESAASTASAEPTASAASIDLPAAPADAAASSLRSNSERPLFERAPRSAGQKSSSSMAELQAAVGVTPAASSPTSSKKQPRSSRSLEHDDGGSRGPILSPRAWGLVIGLIVLIALAATCVLLGRANQNTYYLRCGDQNIVATRGRSFPPWGESTLSGPAWQPIAIPLDASCKDRQAADLDELRSMLREALLGLVDTWLTRERPRGQARDRIDQIQAQLEQALLLSRAASPEVRASIERYLADVEYWRARDQIAAAREQLTAASTRLEAALQRKARYNDTDAARWQELLARIAAMLERGPYAADTPAARTSPAPFTTPNAASDSVSNPASEQSPAAPGAPDAAPGTALPLPADGAPAPSEQPDAGVPPGGTLL